MATPNLANINTYFTRTKVVNVSTTLSNVITNFPFSNSLIKVNSLIVSNESAATTTNVNVMLVSNGIQTNLATKLLMPPGNVITLFNKTNEFNILENSALRANAENNSVIEMVVSYEEMGEKTKNNYIAEAYPIEYLVVAGGGGSGGTQSGVSFSAGGGGGQALEGSFQGSIGTTYTVVVGGGGAANQIGPTAIGNTGSASSITPGVSACGGGGGGVRGVGIGGNSGQTPFCGGTMVNANAGGGGGAGGNGSPAPSPTTAGAGGNGVLSYITGTSTGTRYAGGGGGGGNPNGGLGTDGGGRGLSYLSVPGTAGNVNSGGGGGGDGGGGGSGIVVVRYPTEFNLVRIGNTTGNVTITSNAGYCIYQFTSSGSFTIQ